MRYIEINTAENRKAHPALIFKMPLPHLGQPGGTAHARTEKSCLTTRPAYRGRTFMIRPPPRRQDARALALSMIRRRRAQNGWS